MNIKTFLIVLLLNGTSLALARGVRAEAPCQCYCSDKCGPRSASNPGDAPFFDKKENRRVGVWR